MCCEGGVYPCLPSCMHQHCVPSHFPATFMCGEGGTHSCLPSWMHEHCLPSHSQATFMCGKGRVHPCLPSWKFSDDETAELGTGSAADGDADAIL